MERTRLTPGRPVTADNGEADQAKPYEKGDCVPFPVYLPPQTEHNAVHA
jgi:hypothetical protein